MTIRPIAQLGTPILTKTAQEVSPDSINSPTVKKIIADMFATLYEANGLGLAAPQIYEPYQIIVINPPHSKKSIKQVSPYVLINPTIIDRSPHKEKNWEGCLSIMYGQLNGLVWRHKKIKLTAYNKKGQFVTLVKSGLNARIIQHEVDHLKGIHFIQRMHKKDLKTLTTTEAKD